MTPLRQRYTDDLHLHRYTPRNIASYVGQQVARFARRFARSPDQLGSEQVRQYLLELTAQGNPGAPSSRSSAPCDFSTASR